MDITDPQIVKFSNERIRPLADAFARAYNMAVVVMNQWAAKGLDQSVPNDPSYVIADGSAEDGRSPVTGADLHAIMDAAGMIIGLAQQNDGVVGHQILKVAVNPMP